MRLFIVKLICALVAVITCGLPAHAQRSANFNHNATGFMLDGIHASLECRDCHRRGAPKGIPRDCNNCHAQGGVRSTAAQMANHIPTGTQACSDCHNQNQWTPALMRHTTTMSGQCSTCHNGAYVSQGSHGGAFAKPPSHPLTNASCDVCHAGTQTFNKVNPHFPNNTAAPGSCASCHGVQAVGKPGKHIPTSLSCDACHTNFVAFKPAQFQHDASTIGICSTCHNGSSALGKPAVHIPTSSQCDTCHTSQISFTNRTMNHTGLAGQCATCHGGAYVSQNAQAKNANHVVTAAQCDTCHTSTTTWATMTINHAGLAGYPNLDCASCHNGTTSYSGVIPLSKPATHIPTTGQCSVCHKNYTAFKPAAMDHTGLAGQCSTCHNGSYTAVNAQSKSAAHIPTSRQCDSCHKNYVAFVPASMDHTGLNGQCITCHTGAYVSQNAQIKIPTHQVTTAQCDTCHVNAMTTLSWATSANPHIPVNTAAAGSCGTCHGVTAIGKPTTHVPTTAACDTCHTNFVAFKPAQMNHSGTSGLCVNCHSGSFQFANALPKNTGHIPTSGSCDTCHTNFSAFKPAAMDHTGSSGQCANCHSGSYTAQNAQKQGANHVPTTVQCDTCHLSTVDWGPRNFVHTATSLAITNNCRACHTGQYLSENAQVWSNATIHGSIGTAQCDSCHTNGASSLSWATTTFNHQAASPPSPLGVCSSCHKSGGAGLPKSGTHIPTSTECDSCHRGFTSFRPAAMNHAGESATTCVTCHGGSYTAVNAQTNTSPPHIPTGTTACNKCHTDTVAWANRAMDHTGYTRCVNCHNGSYVSENAQKQGTNHIATGSSTFCSDCHNNFSSWSPAKMDHAKVSPAITCSTCHNGSKLSENAQAKPGTHVPTSAECNSSGCHSTGFTSWRTASNPHLASPPISVTPGACATCHYAGGSGLSKPSNHIPTSSACDTCHTNYVAFKPAQMNHTGTAGQCLACHNGSYTFAGPQGAQPVSSTHIPTTLQCDNCHNTVTFKPATMNHAGAAGRCATCHNGSYLSVGTQGAQTNTSPPHVPVTGSGCDTCHLSTTSWVPMNFLHTATSLPITSNCRACHSGQYLSENAQVQTNISAHTTAPGNTAQCDTCHTNAASSLSWATSANPHIPTNTAAAGACATCHGGSGPGMSKPTNHIPVTDSCDVCHSNGLTNFTAFKPAQMSHTAASVVSAGCRACHDTGKPYVAVNAQQPGSSHIPAPTAQCNVCHTSPGGSWTSRTMSHTTSDVSSATCASCHAAGKPYLSENAQQPGNNHIAIGSVTCSKCHTNFNTFSPAVMDHTVVYPAVVPKCRTCHDGSKLSENAHAQPANHGATGTNDCNTAGCHSGYSTWSLATIPNHSAFAASYGTYPNLTCDGCHNGSKFGSDTPLPKPGNHVPTTAQCSNCHPLTSNLPAAGSFKPAKMSHAAVTSTACATCHNGSYAFANALPQGSTHIPTTAACDGCHTRPTAIPPPNTGWVTPRAMNHTLVASTGCTTCHSGTYLSENAQQKSGTHIPTTEQCDICHNNPGTNPSPAWAPVTKHTALGASKCNTCHIQAYVGAKLQAIPTVHIPTALSATWASCDACHKTGYYTAWANNGIHKAPASRPAAEVSHKCGNCHTSPNSYGIKGPQSVTPHNATKPKPGYDSIDCTKAGGCHNNTKFSSWAP